jgi:hypothetical protein
MSAGFGLTVCFTYEIIIEIEHTDGCAIGEHRGGDGRVVATPNHNARSGAGFCRGHHGTRCGFMGSEDGAANCIQQQ